MDKYEENILRLNKKIRTALLLVETKNRKLKQENHVLVEDVANFRVQFAQAEDGRLRCKAVLEKEVARSHEQHEAQLLLKKRYNDLIREYVAQNEKLKAAEHAQAKEVNKQSRLKRKQPPVEIIGEESLIHLQIDHLEDTNERLERQVKNLKAQLDQCHCVPLTPDTANSLTASLHQPTL
uniref:Uncharacterized protein n=1 Tax=Anopheles dirus TaxID=7168 RepID=A0A182NNP8_9DIPT